MKQRYIRFICKDKYAACVNIFMPSWLFAMTCISLINMVYCIELIDDSIKKGLTKGIIRGIIIITLKRSHSQEEIVAKNTDSKRCELREQFSLNPRPDRVTDPLFLEDEFFDPRDLVQVKYEMLRRVSVEEESITRAASAFGFSRPAFYQARKAFERVGLVGLVPRKRGPRRRHKLSGEVVAFLEKTLRLEGRLSSQILVKRVEERFGIRIHKRSIERALPGLKKKLP